MGDPVPVRPSSGAPSYRTPLIGIHQLLEATVPVSDLKSDPLLSVGVVEQIYSPYRTYASVATIKAVSIRNEIADVLDNMIKHCIWWSHLMSKTVIELSALAKSLPSSEKQKKECSVGALQEKGQFDGQLSDGQMEGLGVFKFTNGDSYEGTWRGNKMHGLGIYR